MSLAAGSSRLDGGSASFEVTVVTPTHRDGFSDSSLPFRVVRRPGVVQLIRLIRAADVVHLAGPCFLPLTIGLVLGKPVVVEHHGFQTICPNGQLLQPAARPCPGHFMARRYEKCVSCNAEYGVRRSLIMFLTTFARRMLCKRVRSNITPTAWLGTLLQLPRSTTVHHAVSPPTSDQDCTVSPSHSTFAFVGRLVSTKGVQTLLEAAQQLSSEGFSYCIKVIGEGPDREALQKRAAVLGLNGSVQWLGYVSTDRLEVHLASAATVIMPSIAGEVFGMVAAENMSRGKLLIASDIGAMREVIGDTGLWFMPGDSAALAQRMKEVLRDSTLASRFGRKAQARAAEQFGPRRMLLHHLDIYQAALG